MKIDGNKRVDNLNTQVFKGSNKDTPDNHELKQVDASAADALNAYGRAMITNKAQTSKDALLKLIDETIKNYEEKLDCDKDRKEEFINELKDLQTFLKEAFEPDEVSDIKLNSYLFKGYIEDDMKLVKELFDAKDKYGNFRFDVWDISSIFEKVTAENRDILPILLDTNLIKSKSWHLINSNALNS